MKKNLLYIPGEHKKTFSDNGLRVLQTALKREAAYEKTHLADTVRNLFSKYWAVSVNPTEDLSQYREVFYIGDEPMEGTTYLCDVKQWYRTNKVKGRPKTLAGFHKESIAKLFKATQASHGTTEHVVETKVNYVYDMVDLRSLVEKIKVQGWVVVDTETMPAVEGVDPEDWKRYNLSFWLSQMRCLLLTPHIGEGWSIPMYDPASWLNMGHLDSNITVMEAVRGAVKYASPEVISEWEGVEFAYTQEDLSDTDVTEFYIYKNGHLISDYVGNPIIFTAQQANAWLDNSQEAKEKSIHNILETQVIPYLREHVFENPEIRKIYHNYSFDYGVLRHVGIKHKGPVEDTMMMCHAISKVESKSLKHHGEKHWVDKLGWASEIDYVLSDFNTLSEYGVNDLDATARLYATKLYELMSKPSVYYAYINATMPSVKWLAEMSYEGEQIDLDKLQTALKETKEKVDLVENQMRQNPVFIRYYSEMQTRYKNEYLEILELDYQAQREKKMLDLKKKIDATPEDKRHLKIYANLIGKYQWLEEETFDFSSPYSYAFAVKYNETQKAVISGVVDKYLLWNKNTQAKSGKKVAGRPVYWKTLEFNFQSDDDLGSIIYTSRHGLNYPQVQDSELKLVHVPGKGVFKKWVEKLTSPHQTKVLWWHQSRYFATDTAEEHIAQCTRVDDSDFIADLMLYKTVYYYYSKLVEIERAVDSSGRIHTSFQIVNTDRTSSSNPNLQNIPQRSWVFDAAPYRSKLLDIFSAPEGFVRAKCDLAQAEIRFFSLVYGITQIAENLASGLDLHIIAAKTCLNISDEQWDALDKKRAKHYRNIGKCINFSLLYGAKGRSLIRYARDQFKITLTEEQANDIRERFLQMLYSEIPEAHKKQAEFAKKLAYSTTLFGTRRDLQFIQGKDKGAVQADIRKAINTPVQGSAGIYTCYAGVRMRLRKEVFNLEGNVVNIIHDDLPCIVPEYELEEYAEVLVNTLTDPVLMPYFGFDTSAVPMGADFEYGQTWATIDKEIKDVLLWDSLT